METFFWPICTYRAIIQKLKRQAGIVRNVRVAVYNAMKSHGLLLFSLLLAAGVASAQLWDRCAGGMGDIHTAGEVSSGSTGTPSWEYTKTFKTDVFTFARIRYERGG